MRCISKIMGWTQSIVRLDRTFICALAILAVTCAEAEEQLPKLALNKIDGRWNVVVVNEDRSNARRPGLRKRLLKDTFTFRRRSATTVMATRNSDERQRDGKSVELVVETSRRGRYLRLKSNTAAMRNIFPVYTLSPIASVPAATILKGEHLYFVRFAAPKGGNPKDFRRLSFLDFCSGPARNLVAAAQAELRAVEVLQRRAPRFYGTYDRSLAAMFGLFGYDNTRRILGVPYAGMPPAMQEDLIGRLQLCAIFHDDSSVSTALGTALFRKFTNAHIRGTLEMRSQRFRDPKVVPKRHPDLIASFLSNEVDVRRELEKSAPVAKKLEGANDARKLEEAIRSAVDRVTPSYLQERAIAASNALDEFEQRRQEAIEAERDRTSPPLSEPALVAQAAKQYFSDNCSKLFLALQASQRGNSWDMIAVAIASPVKARGGHCVSETPTHVGRFRLDRVESVQCQIAIEAKCEWTAYFYCDETLNPKLGFSRQTANLNVRCSHINRTLIQMSGRFSVKSKRRWIANSISW